MQPDTPVKDTSTACSAADGEWSKDADDHKLADGADNLGFGVKSNNARLFSETITVT